MLRPPYDPIPPQLTFMLLLFFRPQERRTIVCRGDIEG